MNAELRVVYEGGVAEIVACGPAATVWNIFSKLQRAKREDRITEDVSVCDGETSNVRVISMRHVMDILYTGPDLRQKREATGARV